MNKSKWRKLPACDKRLPIPLAFTLVEVMAVLVILAMMVGITLASMQSHILRVRLSQATERIEEADRLARMLARREHVSHALTFDAEERSIELQSNQTPNSKKEAKRWQLPSGIVIEDFRTSSGPSRNKKNKVVVASNGVSASYAVGIKIGRASPRWIVTLGMSGQQLRISEEDEVDQLLPK
jgi:Tfp pilus assembly protein FimT